MTEPVEAVTVEQLKPCPGCGKQPSPGLFEADDIGGWQVACCFIAWGDTEAEAIAAWNRRSSLTQAPRSCCEAERPDEAIEVLRGPYRQLDIDGVIVGVSRQAIYETLEYLDRLEALTALTQSPRCCAEEREPRQDNTIRALEEAAIDLWEQSPEIAKINPWVRCEWSEVSERSRIYWRGLALTTAIRSNSHDQ